MPVLKLLKEGLGGHIKKHAYKYRQALDGELARIARIRQMKQGTIEFTRAGVTAGLIGVSNFISNAVYDATNLGSLV